ncbi:MAG: hypothetical protein HN704_03565 [Bacteroidetes bacterium]|jgi:hypothetical protein|nr:hypothetical protein [Bacteroidota bacterium]MBT6686702.1 hypothetical protein [Bacteroidota bacterium]MBT7141840.1 hypothetical protein [Bacteroidota bacterium]MBT7490669.1 hypothetical protein [Bacteroidota bacterium]
MKNKIPILIIFFAAIFVVCCENSFENPIDDDRIIGSWHRKYKVENGIETQFQDSIVHIFLPEGNLIIRYYPELGASIPDENYQFDLQNGVLRYWNMDINVSEENELTFLGSSMQIQIYPNMYYRLFKIE